MTMAKNIGFLLLFGMLWFGGLGFGGALPIPGVSNLSSTAQAEVGRPLTPVSVAGPRSTGSRRSS